jgi:flavin-dependent dehydrogenase
VRFDVAIVGGGPAASVTAWMLARGGASCVILERGDDAGDKPGESLPPSARPLLEQLGLWDALEADGHLPCHGNRSRWGSDELDEQPFLFSPYGHGWHVDRRRFERLLAARAIAAGAKRRTHTRVTAVEQAVGLLHTERGDVRADVFVDATGRTAWLARRLGAQRLVDDRLTANVWFLREQAEDSFTFVEAVEDGWWYTAPIPDGRIVRMFVMECGGLPPLSQSGGEPPHSRVDASSMRLDRVAGDRWLAVGDAAAALDPLSSHGLGSAIAGGLEAARAILTGDVARYETMIETMWNSYVRVRRATYALETRWPAAPFWRYRINTTSIASTVWTTAAREPSPFHA